MATRSWIVALLLACVAAGCTREPDQPPPRPGSRREQTFVVRETVYDGKLGEGWNDWGWAPRELGAGPARLHLDKYGGWIIENPKLGGRFGALTFRMRAPRAFGDFLEVRLESNQKNAYPHILVRAEHRVELEGGWTEVAIPMRDLDPEDLPFDRIVLRAAKAIGADPVLLDKIALTEPDHSDAAPPPPAPAREVALSIDCASAGTPVSPLIYGIAFDPRLDQKSPHQWKLGASARRWGGNPSSRFNWEIGDAWNTANDWYFENVNYTGDPGWKWTRFLDDDAAHHVATALTVPILGWVAKDTTSYSFSIASLGAQRSSDGFKPDAGDGMSRAGKPMPAPAPSRTSVASTPASIGRWVGAIRDRDAAKNTRSVDVYILDNEPMLWNSTHRDVHPEPVGYDELLEKTLAYGDAIRAADPGATIAGPALWGWPAYFYSAKDAAAGFHLGPDRRAHGDVPFLPWYLREVRAHERKTGTRLLDLVDIHFYPQADRVGGADGGTDAATSARRIRSTRALWDPTYTDESWIKDEQQLIPRLKKWIDENAPGLGIQIGEWNFGAEQHTSGGIAVAETLGRFAENGVRSAFYWTFPPEGSPAFWAFRAYRDFDGAGGRFLDRYVASKGAEGMSIFASRDGAHVVAIVLNLDGARSARATISITGARPSSGARLFCYAGGATGFSQGAAEVKGATIVTEPLAPYSINVVDLHLEGQP